MNPSLFLLFINSLTTNTIGEDMKILKLLEENDREDMIARAASEADKNKQAKFEYIRDTLERDELATLKHLVDKKLGKKAKSKRIDPDHIDVLNDLGLMSDKGSVNETGIAFIEWYTGNRMRSDTFSRDRSQAQRKLGMNVIGKDNKAKLLVSKLSEDELQLFKDFSLKTGPKTKLITLNSWLTDRRVSALKNMGVLEKSFSKDREGDGNLRDRVLSSLTDNGKKMRLYVLNMLAGKTVHGTGKLSRSGMVKDFKAAAGKYADRADDVSDVIDRVDKDWERRYK